MPLFAIACALGIALSTGTSGKSRSLEGAKAEKLPAPRGATELLPLLDDFQREESSPRTSRWSVWQYYSVSQSGHFRPRVIYTPEGSYNARTGEPYPWFGLRNRDIMPYVVDQ